MAGRPPAGRHCAWLHRVETCSPAQSDGEADSFSSRTWRSMARLALNYKSEGNEGRLGNICSNKKNGAALVRRGCSKLGCKGKFVCTAGQTLSLAEYAIEIGHECYSECIKGLHFCTSVLGAELVAKSPTKEGFVWISIPQEELEYSRGR